MDYEKLGFKCGIEIHQQLETNKLFCNCPSLVNDPNEPDIIVKRKLTPVAGETGEIDIAALHEKKKKLSYIYEACSSSSCLVELDEEPPFPINKQAVQIALQISQLLNAKIVGEIQVMRKTVLDGSNTTGFQRTALVAQNGYVDTSKGKVSITVICLEEEAAKKIKTDENSITYRLDRLGVPLLEIATGPDIKDPEHAKETAEKIGMILRSTNKVKRGIGTIRQDINISIKDRNRVELKGFQDLRSIPKVIENEIKRQLALKKKTPSEVRKVEPDSTTSFLRPMPGAARMYPETDVLPIKPIIEETEKIELIENKIQKYEKLGLSKDLATLTAKSGKTDLFEKFADKFKNIKPAFIAETLISTLREIKRKYEINTESITEKEFEEIFNQLNKDNITKDIILDILIDYAKGIFKDFSQYSMLSDQELEKELEEIISKNKGAPFGTLMGQAMSKLKGKASGSKISEILKLLMKKV